MRWRTLMLGLGCVWAGLVLLRGGLLCGAEPVAPIRVLFLGDQGHHRPADRFRQLAPVLAERGIKLSYTENLADLNPRTLAEYDGLAIYANTTKIEPEQEQTLLAYVSGGRGLIPLHCASYCFLNSPKYIALVGAQFQRHGVGTFRAQQADSTHPLMKGFRGFESWDETYVHTQHNEQNRTVLEFRQEGEAREPWTWVRTEGKGRVFYTAWGHDERTWSHPGFQNLVERGIRWAVGRDPGVVPAYADRPEMTSPRRDVAPFRYVPAKVPFYPPGQAWGKLGPPAQQMQEPLAAEESQKHFVRPVGFEVQLFASEPQIGKPICLNWDERGRLWVAETVDYPNEIQPEGAGRDRIRICEDTDGDGRADRFTVFAEKLSIPTSLTFAQGGVVVHQAPHTLFLRDTNGDDVADERRILFSGWSTGDTHAGPSNLQYGLDNWLYGIVGYAGFAGQIGGENQAFRTGFYRFRPDGSKLEFLRNTNNNSWGVGFSEEGALFGSTANGNPSEHLPIPNRYYERVRGWSSTALGGISDNPEFHPLTDRVRQVDHHHRFTAAAGHALYTARAWPTEYWNRAAFVCEPTGHLVATFAIQGQGAGFRSRNAWNLLASDDEWTAPIVAEVGPDGQVWVIDWYNYIVQHNPTPAGFQNGKGNAYETPLRDKTHGRVYRVVYGESPPEKPFSLAGASPEKLVETLRHTNFFWRRHAQRLLVERGKDDVAAALIGLVGDRQSDGLGLNPGAIHALWTLHGLGLLEGRHPAATEAALSALRHPAAGVRRNAVQVLSQTPESVTGLLDSGVLRDPSAQVRLLALLAVADQPATPSAAKAVAEWLAAGEAGADRWLIDAATAAAARQEAAFLLAAAGSKDPSPALLAVLERVAEHVARGPNADASPLLAALAQATPASGLALAQGLVRGWPKDRAAKLTEADERALVALVRRLPDEARSHLVTLAGRWGSTQLERYTAEIVQAQRQRVLDPELPTAARLAAAAQLVEFRRQDAKIVAELLAAITPRSEPDFALGLLEAAGRSEAEETGRALLARASSLTPGPRQAALRLLLSRGPWTRDLLAALESNALAVSDLSLDQQQALAAHPDKQLAARAQKLLARGGGLPSPDRQKVLDDLAGTALQTGDAVAGKALFKKHCAKCHVHSGEGNKVGPELTGMAVHPKQELLIPILDPSRSVEGNFRAYTATTTTGKVLTGLLASETKSSIELIDAEGKRQVVLREEIEDLVGSKKSLMPEGFEKQVTPKELADLLEFLTQRGKFTPLALDKHATVISTRGMFFSEESTVERMIFPDWKPKTFQGVPFLLVDPQGDRQPNAILFYGPQGTLPPRMPKSVTLPCNAPARAIHLLSGVSGWGHPLGTAGTVSLIVRLHYADGQTEDHPLKNGEHFADYIRRVDVPGSQFAFALRSQQLRYLAVHPRRPESISRIELVKGPDATAPIVMAVTLERVE